MGTIFGFMKNLGKQKLGDAGRSLTEAIVSWDPEAASQAEIETMIDDLDKITREAANARQTFQKDKQQADAARGNYDRHLQAAEILSQKLEAAKTGGNEAEVQSLGASLEKLLKELETLRPEVEREAKDADDAKSVMEELEEFAGMAAQKLKTARSQLEAGKRDMQRAELEKQRAQETRSSIRAARRTSRRNLEPGSGLVGHEPAGGKGESRGRGRQHEGHAPISRKIFGRQEHR